jgi:hypothetical protein
MTETQENREDGDGRRQRWRNRLRSCYKSKTGKTVGIATVVAPLAGFLVNDLRKPDSVVRSAISAAAKKLALSGSKARKKLDISDKAEVVELDE